MNAVRDEISTVRKNRNHKNMILGVTGCASHPYASILLNQQTFSIADKQVVILVLSSEMLIDEGRSTTIKPRLLFRKRSELI